MSRQRVEAAGTTSAPIEEVWRLVADANRYAAWGPWEDGGYRPPSDGPSRPGMTQWFRYGRGTTTTERILDVDPPHLLRYTVTAGIPVRDYRAEVTLAPAPDGGTTICWRATWDGGIVGWLVRRRLQHVYVEVVGALVDAARREAASRR